MKKIIYLILLVICFIMLAGNKVYAKPILPPEDVVPTPYIDKLGGYAIYNKTLFDTPNDCGYYYYKMPYTICLVESSSLYKAHNGDSFDIIIEKKAVVEYDALYSFATSYSSSYSNDFRITLGGRLINLNSSYKHTFNNTVLSKIANQKIVSYNYTSAIKQTFTNAKEGFYYLAMYTYFDVWVIQKFDINMVNGYPQKVASGDYDITMSKSDKYEDYNATIYRETNEISSKEIVENNILYVDNVGFGIVECLNKK